MTKKSVLTIAIVSLIVLMLAWHFLFPFASSVIAISVTAWLAIIFSIIVFSVAIMLIFVLTGLGLFLLGLAAFVWILTAVIFLPILFPILMPLFIVFLVIAYQRRKQKN